MTPASIERPRARLNADERHDLLEIMEDRYQLHSTIVASQVPVDKWHEAIGDPSVGDAVLDRLNNNAYRIALTGESMRRKPSGLTQTGDERAQAMSYRLTEVAPNTRLGDLSCVMFDAEAREQEQDGFRSCQKGMQMTRLATVLIVVLAFCLTVAEGASAQSAPEFRLGFKALADQIPDTIGRPLENEHYSANGDSLQATANGLMVWRKADNWTAFTDGYRTWINGPNGLEIRLNTERLPWEQGASRLTMEQLKNAEYQVEKQRVQLSDGQARLQPTGNAFLVEQWTNFGDLNGDVRSDAAVVLVSQPGGSGTFFYLVAMLDRDGSPVQGAITLLGDRVRIQSLSVAEGQIRVGMLTQGPGDPIVNPTLLVERGYRLSGGDLVASN